MMVIDGKSVKCWILVIINIRYYYFLAMVVSYVLRHRKLFDENNYIINYLKIIK